MQTLLNDADLAFSRGENKQGLLLLRKYNKRNRNDPGTWHRQAIIEEQIGEHSRAGHAHYQSIKLAPSVAIGYLYAGYWLQQNGKIDAAAAAYSLFQEIAPNGFTLQKNARAPIAKRVSAANTLLRETLSTQHRNFCDRPELSRIRNSVWVRTHDNDVVLDEANFEPQLFFIPDLPRKPIYSSTDFDWADSLKSKTNVIRAELTAALQHSSEETLRPYLTEGYNHGPLQELAGSTNWSALDLFREGVENTPVTAKFPKTLEALKSIPHYSLGDEPYEVFFSLLKPKQKIAPHYGLSNHALTTHLALEVPSDCFLKVAEQNCSWKTGELLIFDDSFLHSAHNQSDQLRIVLIFSIWNPELRANEQKAIQGSFIARRDWLDMRLSKLQQLIK